MTIKSKIINALALYKELAHTIASDNGKEFTKHQHIAQKLETNYFFAHPYSSWNRRLNEYTNKPFGNCYLKNYEPHYLANIQNKLNSTTGESLQYKTPLQVFMLNFNPN